MDFFQLILGQAPFKVHSRNYGCAFSSSGNKIYFIQDEPRLEQLDSKTLEITKVSDDWNMCIQLGPNGKIYLYDRDINIDDIEYLSVIENPDSESVNCNFKYKSIDLFKKNQKWRDQPTLNFSNIPNFRLGPIIPTYTRTDTLLCRGDSVKLGCDHECPYNYSWVGIKIADSTVKILNYKFDSVGVYKFWRHRFSASQGCTTAVDTFVVMLKTTAPPCAAAQEKHVTPKAKIKIYPNPAKDNFMITSNQRVLRVRLFDINGKKITEYIPDGYPETLTFNVAIVHRGFYLCEVDTEGGKITQRVVVER